MRRILGILLVLGMVVGGVGCEPEEVIPIKIGLQGPMTGEWSAEGEGFRRAVELVAEQINEQGGLLDGRPLEIVVEDDRGDPDVAQRAAENLVEAGVVAVIGGYNSDATEAAMSVFADQGILHLSPSATATHLTQKGYERFFRLSFADERQGVFAAGFMLGTLNVSKVAFVHDGSDYAQGLAETARDALEEQGEETVLFQRISPGQRDFSELLSELEDSGAELLFFSGYYPDAALIARQLDDESALRELDMMGGDAVYNPEFISIAGGEPAVGTIVTTMPLPEDIETAEATAFKAAYEDAYGSPPGAVWTLTAADAMRLIAQAIEETGTTDGAALADYLRGVEDYQGVSGEIQGFDAQGERLGSPLAVYVVNRNWEFVPYQP